MDEDSNLDPNLAEIKKTLQEIRNLPAALLQTTFDLLIPTDRAPHATFRAKYNDDEINIGLRACLLVWTVTYSKLVPREFQPSTSSKCWALDLNSFGGAALKEF